MTALSRRALLKTGAAAAALSSLPQLGIAQEGEAETHGLSSFGDLQYPPDFKHFNFVNPNAPKGGTLALQIRQSIGNQNFETFNTLNIYVLKGDGAAGMSLTFDSLMTASGERLGILGDEPDAVYGLTARSVRVSEDKLTYRFILRPEARFHDGSRLTARDAVFSLNIMKEKSHPTFRLLLTEMAFAEAESDDVLRVQLTPQRGRDLHLVIAALPIFSERYWQGKDFEGSTLEAPLGSGPYKVSRFEQGRFIEFERAPDYWGKDLPVNVGLNNFDRIRYEYFRDRTVAFEAFKNGTLNYNDEYTSRIWATGYDFPAVREGRVKREEISNDAPTPIQGWYFNTRRDAFRDPRIRQAIGLAFDFEWTNANIMFGSYRRLTSFFENSTMKAEGLPSPEELALLEPFRDKLPAAVFGEPYVPPVTDGSGQDRQLLRRADELLRQAGCKREGGALKLPNGQPLTIEFLDSAPTFQPHIQPFQANLKRLGIEARSRIVDAAQYQRRLETYDYDVVSRALTSSPTPRSEELQVAYGSKAGQSPGSYNVAGIADAAVDALIDKIGAVKSRAELIIAVRALDRVLRAGHYWVPMWFKAENWIASWDQFSRPGTKPRFSTGAPWTWWHDAEKAKRIGRG